MDFGLRFATPRKFIRSQPCSLKPISYIDGPAQWRFPVAFQAFFAILLVLQMLPLPETPRYLALKDQTESASLVLARLRGTDDVNDPDVLFQRRQIESGIEIESAGGPFRYRELLQGGRIGNLRRIILCLSVNVMQQFTGANMINYYAPVVYQQTMGLTRNLSLILGGCTALVYLGGSLIPLWVSLLHSVLVVSIFQLAAMANGNECLGNGSFRPPASPHVICRRAVLVLFSCGHSALYWDESNRVRLYCNGVCLPNLPRHWLASGALVLPIRGNDYEDSIQGTGAWLLHQLDVCVYRCSDHSNDNCEHSVAQFHYIRGSMRAVGTHCVLLLPGNQSARARGCGSFV